MENLNDKNESIAFDMLDATSRLPKPLRPFWAWSTSLSAENRPTPKTAKAIAYETLASAGVAMAIGAASVSMAVDAIQTYSALGLIMAAATAAPAFLLAGNAKVKGGSVVIHHASHGTGKQRNWLAELVGIATLVQPVQVYWDDHKIHHFRSKVATVDDPDGKLISDLGFRPGMSVEEGWKLVWKALLSPVTHAGFIRTRLAHNFFRWKKDPSRTLASWVFWTLAFGAAGGAGFAAELAVFLPVAMAAGNMAALLELFTRHPWLTTATGKDRTKDLSNYRFYGSLPPANLRSLAGLKWMVRQVGAGIERAFTAPIDLGWHAAHHMVLDKQPHREQPAWANAAEAIGTDGLGKGVRIHTSVRAAIRYWLEALSKEGP